MAIRVHFWGTRGSLPAPLDAAAVRAKVRAALVSARGRDFADDAAVDAFVAHELPFSVGGTFGGNSSCVQIDAGDPEFLLCDAGSGLRVFGNAVLARDGPGTKHTYHIVMSHLHWDHIMGFPFFTPAYIPGNTIRIYSCQDFVRAAFGRQHGPPSFPIAFDALGATIEFEVLEPGQTYDIAGFAVTATKQHHGGDSFGYRFVRDGKTIVYATDSEHKFAAPGDERPFIELFRNADVLVFDAMYSLGESVTMKEDWGHSSNVVGVELAHDAGVKQLVLFHHEPAHDDATLERIESETRRYEEITRDGAAPLQVTAAYDGLEIEI